MRKVDFILPYARGKRVLDIGVVAHHVEAYSSENWLHKHLIRVSKVTVGIDILSAGIDSLKQQGFDVHCLDAQNFSFDEKFDVVVAGDILEHLHDFKGFFCSVDRVLKPEGYLIITTASAWFFVRIAQAMLPGKVYENPEHTVWFSIGILTELLKRYGYSVEHAKYGSSEQFLFRLFFCLIL